MNTPDLNIVTGAFGYIGRHITQRLLKMGERVKTLTGHPNRPNPFGDQVVAAPFNFDNPAELTRGMEGASTLYNTYWVRFPYGQMTFQKAIQNTLTLIKAAKDAGVSRIVHISITNPGEESPLPYFHGKAVIEKAIIQSDLSYAIIRPTVIFGGDDILINNIAWFLRRFPVFVIPGLGQYKLQPIYVEDVAEIAVQTGHQTADTIIDVAGPEIYSYEDLVKLIRDAIGSKAYIIYVPTSLSLFCSKILGLLVNDVVLTKEEIDGLMSGLLVSNAPPTGKTLFSNWIKQNTNTIGTRYSSEMDRHYLR
jgi:NADH dehydrogenase